MKEKGSDEYIIKYSFGDEKTVFSICVLLQYGDFPVGAGR